MYLRCECNCVCCGRSPPNSVPREGSVFAQGGQDYLLAHFGAIGHLRDFLLTTVVFC